MLTEPGLSPAADSVVDEPAVPDFALPEHRAGGQVLADTVLADTVLADTVADGPLPPQIAADEPADAFAQQVGGIVTAPDPAALRAAGSGADRGAPADESDPVLSGQIIPISLLRSSGQVALTSSPGQLPAVRAGDEADWLANVVSAVLAWAARRRLGLVSACGIFLALAVCAATWFSAGDRTDILRGVAALWAGYLVLKTGQAAGVLPAAQSAVRADWLATLGSSLAECVAYAGLAAGAVAEQWNGVWLWAVAVVGLIAVRNLMSACSAPPGFGESGGGAVRQLSLAVLTMPAGGRILLVGIVAPVWGPRAALLALADWAIVSIACGLAGRVRPQVAADELSGGQPAPSGLSPLRQLRDDGALARALGNLVRGTLLPLPPAILGLLAVAALSVLGLHGLPVVLMVVPVIVLLLAAPGSSHPHAGRLDWLVPALLLGSQVLYLNAIGVGARVPGPVIFALVAALLVHYADLAVPDRPVLLAKPRQPGERRWPRGTGLGWEGRLLIAGLAAAVGIATFAYLALTAYLAALICVRIVTSSLARPAERHP